MVHQGACPLFGRKEKSSCQCPRHLSYGSLDSLAGKLHAMLAQASRPMEDSVVLGYGNPAASFTVKTYFKAGKEEEFLARTIPT